MSGTTKLYNGFKILDFGAFREVYLGSGAYKLFKEDPRLQKHFLWGSLRPNSLHIGNYALIPVYTDVLVADSRTFLDPDAVFFLKEPILDKDSIQSVDDFIDYINKNSIEYSVVRIGKTTYDDQFISEWARNFLTVLDSLAIGDKFTVYATKNGYSLTMDLGYEVEAPTFHEAMESLMVDLN